MTKQYNIDVVGSLTNNNGVLSGFTSNDYATFQAIAPGNVFFDSTFKFNCTTTDGEQMIWYTGLYSASYGALSLRIYENKFYVFFGKNNGGIFDINGTTTLQPNTDYWVKLTCDGGGYYNLYLSTDGENYTLEGSKTAWYYLGNDNEVVSQIGCVDGNYPLQGTIDLNQSYFVYGGSMWQGVTDVRTSSQKQYNVGFIGNLTNNNGVLSGLSGESCAVLNNTSQIPQGAEWEVNICATTGPDVSGWYGIITPFTDQHGMRIDINNSHFEFLFGDKNNGWYNVSAGYIASSYTVLPNTKYYLRAKCEVQDNSQLNYSFSYSLDGENYEVLLSYGNKTNQIPLDGYWLGAELAGGSIDLNECYIKLKGAVVWRGAGYDTYDFEKDETGNYTLKDNILSSPQEGILFKNAVTLPALTSSGANERDIVVFETSVKGQDVDPTYFACAWIGSNDLPTTQNFSDSYGFFRLENRQMQAGLASYNTNNGQGEWHSKTSQSINISSESFIDLRFEIFRYNNQLRFQANYKPAAEFSWYGVSGGAFDADRYYSEGGDYSAYLFVRADNAEYVPYTDLTKTRILVNGNTVWQASEVSKTAPVPPTPPTPVETTDTFEFVQKMFTLGGSEEDTTSTFMFFRRGFIMGGTGSSPTPTPTWQDVVLSGNGSLTLTNAKANSLNYLKLFGGCEQRNLPSEYTQVDGVKNASNGYIDTGIVADVDDMEFDIVTTINSSSTISWYILQSRLTSTSAIYGISGSATNNAFVGGFSGTSISIPYTTLARTKDHTYHINFTCKNGTSTLIVEDLTDGITATNTGTYTFTAATTNIGLFSNMASGTVNSGNTSVLSAYIKKSGVKVMEYIACTDSSSVAGFYDKATNSFKGATGGSLSAETATVPSPITPVNIVCNNGAVKYSLNLFNPAYYTGESWYVATNNTVANAAANGTLVMPCKPNTTYSWWHTEGRGGARAFELETETVTQGQSATWAVGNPAYVEARVIKTYTTSANAKLLCILFARVDNTNVNRTKEEQLADFMLVEGNVQTAIDYQPYVEGGIYTDGTVETVQDSHNNTATATDLLAVGTIKDEQEVLTGAVTRNIGVKVLDGTENWVKGSSLFYSDTVITDFDTENNFTAYCTHYLGTDNSSAPANDSNCIRLYKISNGNKRTGIYAVRADYADAQAFADFLAQQYQAGTPVTIVYPLDTATTETVTGQTLTTKSGSNTIEITQASISNLPLEASYKAHD